MAKVLCVLYDDPVDGYPESYARDDIPPVRFYPGGQSAPSPRALDLVPGRLLGSVSGELGLRQPLMTGQPLMTWGTETDFRPSTPNSRP